MATTATTKRVNISTLTEKTDNMTFNNWNVNFVYKNKQGEVVKDISISANLIKTQPEGGIMNGYLNYNRSGSNTTVNFSNAEYDEELVAAINTEVAAIINLQAKV